MKKALSLLVLLLSALPAHALEPWTTRDTAVQLTYTALCLVDLLQTSATAGPHATAIEVNPLIGKNPSHLEVDAFLGTSLLLHWGIARVLPRPYREVFQGVTLVVKAGLVGYNIHNGILFTAPW